MVNGSRTEQTVKVGDTAPNFHASVATEQVEPFELKEHLGDGPVVLAFFPAAFTGTCTTELCTFRDRLSRFEDVGATVFGISTDLPFALREFREQESLTFGLVGDADHEAVDAYGVIRPFERAGIGKVAKRSVFVLGTDGTVIYRWVAEKLGTEPPYDTVEKTVADAN